MMNWPLIVGMALVGAVLWTVWCVHTLPPLSVTVRSREDGCRWESRKVDAIAGHGRRGAEWHFLISPAGEILAQIETLPFGVRVTSQGECRGEFETVKAAMDAVDGALIVRWSPRVKADPVGIAP
jgi:hypothetical protein